MRRVLLATLLAATLGSTSGCCIVDSIFHCPCGRWRGGGCPDGVNDCSSCGSCANCDGPYADGPGGPMYGGGPRGAMQYADEGPPTGHVGYPYYTTRGPRDFLARNPGGIGP